MISTMARNKAKDALALCLGVILIGCLVQAAGWMKGDGIVFPAVPEILRAFVRLLGTGSTWQKIGVTLRHLVEVMAISTVLGIAIGLLEGLNRFFRLLMRPTMIFLRSIPMIVLIVITMVLVKYDQVPLIASVIMLVPLISEAACEGCLRIDPELKDVYRLNSPLNGRVLWHVYLPLMAGYLRQAFESAVGMGIKLVVTTEYLVQTRNSLGKAIYTSAYFSEYSEIYAYALIMILLVLLVSELPGLLGRGVRALKKQQPE